MKVSKAAPPRPKRTEIAPVAKAARPKALVVRPDDPPAVAEIKTLFTRVAGSDAPSLYQLYEDGVIALNNEGEGRIRARYDLGYIFNSAARYGDKSPYVLGEALGKTASFVTEHRRVAERISEDELNGLLTIRTGAGLGLDWMHLVALSNVPDQKRRRAYAIMAAERRLSVDQLVVEIKEASGQLTADPAQGGGRPFAAPKSLAGLVYRAKQTAASTSRYLEEGFAPYLEGLVLDTPPDKVTPEMAELMQELYANLCTLRQKLDSVEPQVRAQLEVIAARAAAAPPAQSSLVIDVEPVVVSKGPARPAARPAEPKPAARTPARPSPPRPAALAAPPARKKKP